MIDESVRLSACSCPWATFHPCEACQPESPCDQSAWYNTVPFASVVGVGCLCPVLVTEACGEAALGRVGEAPGEQAISKKMRHPTRNAPGTSLRVKVFFERKGTLPECHLPMNSESRAIYDQLFLMMQLAFFNDRKQKAQVLQEDDKRSWPVPHFNSNKKHISKSNWQYPPIEIR